MVTDQLTSFGPAPKQAMIMAIQRVENMRKLLIATLVGSFGALATQGPALAQWPASSSSWKSYSGSTDNCVSRAQCVAAGRLEPASPQCRRWRRYFDLRPPQQLCRRGALHCQKRHRFLHDHRPEA